MSCAPSQRNFVPSGRRFSPPSTIVAKWFPASGAGLRREAHVAVREEDLGLRDSARVEHDLAGVRVAGRVLGAEPEVEIAERDPARLSAPADMDDPRLERKTAAGTPPMVAGGASASRLAGELEPAGG